jgi:hypothetical protein
MPSFNRHHHKHASSPMKDFFASWRNVEDEVAPYCASTMCDINTSRRGGTNFRRDLAHPSPPFNSKHRYIRYRERAAGSRQVMAIRTKRQIHRVRGVSGQLEHRSVEPPSRSYWHQRTETIVNINTLTLPCHSPLNFENDQEKTGESDCIAWFCANKVFIFYTSHSVHIIRLPN